MGRHSSPGPGNSSEEGASQTGHLGRARRRSVSIGVIIALVTVIGVVAVVILWRFLGDALSDRSGTAAGRCVEGEERVAVVADPAIADHVRQFAESFNETADPVGDRCVAVDVNPADSDAVIGGFIGKWPANLGERPALWIPGSSVSAARLEAATGVEAISDSRSLVTSPVLLAVRPELKSALAEQNWATLPGLQNAADSLTGLDLESWGSLRLVLPVGGDSDASYLAAEAVAAASAPSGAPASAGSGAVRTLVAGQPKLPDNSAAEAMNALLDADDPATAEVHAVISTEQQLFARGESLPDASSELAGWLPPGPVAVADYPTVLLSGSWLSNEQETAASQFARFMRKPEQLDELASDGFRAGSAEPPGSDVTDFAPLGAPLIVGDNTVRATLADALTAPATGPTVTIMLDQSMPTEEGGKTRLTNVVDALDNRIKAIPPESAVGLWTFDGRQSRTEVPTGPLSDPVDGQPRSAVLTAALNAQDASGGGAVSFTTLRIVYNDALANFRQGQSNSVLVITTGPHTDRTLDSAGLQDFVREANDPNRPIAVNVIDFGDDADRATWEAVAQLSGGTYQNLTTSDSAELTTAITTFLS